MFTFSFGSAFADVTNTEANAIMQATDYAKAQLPEAVQKAIELTVKNGANAGQLVKTAATICGGGGGGRPDSATAGGKDASKIAEAIAAVEEMLK